MENRISETGFKLVADLQLQNAILGDEFQISVQQIDSVKIDHSILSEKEKIELESISHEERKRSWWKAREVLSQLCLRNGLDYHGLKKGNNGKPHFVKDSPYHCSLSHSESHAAALLSKKSCGLDIEKVGEKAQRIFPKFSNEKELPKHHSIEDYTRIWAAKESVYKALDIPGILFRDEMILVGWSHGKSVAEIEYRPKSGSHVLFECHLLDFENLILAFTLLQ